MQYEKKYWSSGEYQKEDGTDYNGYVGIYDGGGYIFDTEELLVKKNNYSQQINSSKYFFDRLLHEDLKLPYDKNTITLQANDFLSSGTIKSILEKLQRNNDYIFRSAIISSTYIPNTDNCLILASEDREYYTYLKKHNKEVVDSQIDGFYQLNEDGSTKVDEDGIPVLAYETSELNNIIDEIVDAYTPNQDYNENKTTLGDSLGRFSIIYYKDFQIKRYVEKEVPVTVIKEITVPMRDKDGNILYDEYGNELTKIEQIEVEEMQTITEEVVETKTVKMYRSASDFMRSYNGQNYKFYPNVTKHVDLTEGELKTYALSKKTTTNTKLDSTFYTSVVDGKKTEPLFDFDSIVNAELCIRNIKMVNVSENKSIKCVELFIFLLFKNKLVIIPYDFYPNDFDENLNNPNINFRNNTVLTLEYIDPSNKNSLNFLSLKDIRIYEDELFLVDDSLNMVLRYDIHYLKNSDIWVDEDKTEISDFYNIKSMRLLDMLQGDGSLTDSIYFNKPCSICSDGDNIYVADSGNSCIKVYSSSFDYTKTLKNGYFTKQEIQTISINPYAMTLDDGTEIKENSLWVFCSTGISMTITVISDGKQVYYKAIEKIKFIEDEYSWDEEFKSVKFSFTNSNYYYICTTKRVYKLHLSKPYYPFGSLSYFKQRILLSTMVWSRVPYPWHILPDGEDGITVTWSYKPPKTSAEVLENKCFALIGNDSMINIENTNEPEQFNGDIIFHIGNLYDESKVVDYIKRNLCKFEDIPKEDLTDMLKCSGLFLYNEPASFISSVSKIDVPSYIEDDIEEIQSEEYVNPLTFNKMIYKVAYNLITIKNILMGTFQSGPNLDSIFIYDSLILDDFFQNLRIDDNHDFFVHDNESVSITLNRIFEKILYIQNVLLEHMQTKYIAQPSFTNNSFRII